MKCDYCRLMMFCPYEGVADAEQMEHCVYYIPPERICKNLANEYKHGNFRCSECGFHAWTCDECYSRPEDWSYCPECGAEVICNE